MALFPDWDDQPARAVIHEPPEEPIPAMTHELSRQDADENEGKEFADFVEHGLRESKGLPGSRLTAAVRPQMSAGALVVGLNLLQARFPGLQYQMRVCGRCLNVFF